MIELIPKKSLKSLITVVALLFYSTINFDKTYSWITLPKYYYNEKIIISGNSFLKKWVFRVYSAALGTFAALYLKKTPT